MKIDPTTITSEMISTPSTTTTDTVLEQEVRPKGKLHDEEGKGDSKEEEVRERAVVAAAVVVDEEEESEEE